jgi:hypothetical protein
LNICLNNKPLLTKHMDQLKQLSLDISHKRPIK